MQNKRKLHSQTQLCFVKKNQFYTVTCFISFWIIPRPSYKLLKHSSSSSSLHYTSERANYFYKNIKTLTIFCSCFKFFFFLLKLSSKVVPYIFILKLRSLIDVSNSVPACECIKWDAEQVLILENKFCLIIENVLENHL
jgi:hypothetical protein